MNYIHLFFIIFFLQPCFFNTISSLESVDIRAYLQGRYDHATQGTPQNDNDSYALGYNDSKNINPNNIPTVFVEQLHTVNSPHTASLTPHNKCAHILAKNIVDTIIKRATQTPLEKLNQQVEQILTHDKHASKKIVQKQLDQALSELIKFSADADHLKKLPACTSLINQALATEYMPKTTLNCAAFAHALKNHRACDVLIEKVLEKNPENIDAHLLACKNLADKPLTETVITDLAIKTNQLLKLYSKNKRYKNTLKSYLTDPHLCAEIRSVFAAAIAKQSSDVHNDILSYDECLQSMCSSINELILKNTGDRAKKTVENIITCSGAKKVLFSASSETKNEPLQLALSLITHFFNGNIRPASLLIKDLTHRHMLVRTGIATDMPTLCYHTADCILRTEKDRDLRYAAVCLLGAATHSKQIDTHNTLKTLFTSNHPQEAFYALDIINSRVKEDIRLRNLFMTTIREQKLYLNYLFQPNLQLFIQQLSSDTEDLNKTVQEMAQDIDAALAHENNTINDPIENPLDILQKLAYWHYVCEFLLHTKNISEQSQSLIKPVNTQLKGILSYP